MQNYTSREKLFTSFDEYSLKRKTEIDRSKTIGPLLKSYFIETSRSENEAHIHELFEDTKNPLIFKQIDDDLFMLKKKDNTIGYLEKLMERFWVLYTTDRSEHTDSLFNRLITNSPALDHTWFSDEFFESIWSHLIELHEPQRFIKISFEYDDRFSSGDQLNESQQSYLEKHVRSMRFSERKHELSNKRKALRDLLPAPTSSLRIPSVNGPGGHDIYYNGKVTNRSSNFFEHRSQLLTITRIYRSITENIEDTVWFGSEKNHIKLNSEYLTIKGAPIIIDFIEPLSQEKYDRFITQTFAKNQGPFRLWGNPIKLDEKTVHIYGLDLHLWQKIFLELSPHQFTIILPERTCGNTIHRLVTNIQRYLEPRITVSIGNLKYDTLISSEFLKEGDR